jgi:hypothetical protein
VNICYVRAEASKQLPITIYGIKNCDTMKARAWLDKHGIAYAVHTKPQTSRG